MKVGIIGLGYVGIPLALTFTKAGVEVLGFDIDESKIKALSEGRSYIEHISAEDIRTARAAGFDSTTDFKRIGEPDALIICVPTPLNEYREPDMSFVDGTMKTITPHLRKGQMLSLESTTYPGTTSELVKGYLDSRGFITGEDFYLVYSPEREDPANPDFSTSTIPKVVAGHTPACLEKGMEVYGRIIDKLVPVSSTETAEMVKLLENIYRAVNIGLVNEMKIVCDKMGIDIFEVIRAASTKPFGFTPFYPGPGLGGHCIPIDPFYLTWRARAFGVNTRFIELAGEVNRDMPQFVVNKIAHALNDKQRSVKGAKILALGVAYKKNVDDMRESPSIEVMELLRDAGAIVDYTDPHVPVFPPMRHHRFELKSVPVTPAALKQYDVVVMLTDHDSFDYDLLLEHAPLLVDTRGKFDPKHPRVVAA
jgi:UDP-N-acetyl-D-glucosamine dehydrogenase